MAPTWTQIGFTVSDAVPSSMSGCYDLPPALVINNGTPTSVTSVGNGSIVTLTNGGSTSPSSPIVYGSVEINNNNAQPMQSNQVNFVFTDVYGGVTVNNFGGGATRTSVQHSILGEQLIDNGPVQVVNSGVGENQYLMTGSQLPWGLAVDNSTTSFANSTIIDSSFIGLTANGAHPQTQVCFDDLPSSSSSCICGPQSGDSLYVTGSLGGPDTFVLRNNSVVENGVDLQLGYGDKNVALDSSRMSCFEMVTCYESDDQLWIGGTTITDSVYIALGSGNDQIWLQEGNTNGLPDSLPNQISGIVVVYQDSVPGVSTVYFDANDATQAFPFFLLGTTAVEQTVAIPSWALVPSS